MNNVITSLRPITWYAQIKVGHTLHATRFLRRVLLSAVQDVCCHRNFSLIPHQPSPCCMYSGLQYLQQRIANCKNHNQIVRYYQFILAKFALSLI